VAGIDESDQDAYEDIWKALARRFGGIDENFQNMRNFDQRRQNSGETIAEYEQALRTLYFEAFPLAPKSQKDCDLKRRFEAGLASAEMTNFLRLHARQDDFAETVKKARQFETIGQKKTVKIAADPPVVNRIEASTMQDVLESIRGIVKKNWTSKRSLRVSLKNLESAPMPTPCRTHCHQNSVGAGHPLIVRIGRHQVAHSMAISCPGLTTGRRPIILAIIRIAQPAHSLLLHLGSLGLKKGNPKTLEIISTELNLYHQHLGALFPPADQDAGCAADMGVTATITLIELHSHSREQTQIIMTTAVNTTLWAHKIAR